MLNKSKKKAVVVLGGKLIIGCWIKDVLKDPHHFPGWIKGSFLENTPGKMLTSDIGPRHYAAEWKKLRRPNT